MKIVCHKRRAILADCKAFNNKNENASVITEIITPMDQLTADLKEEIKAVEQILRKERDEITAWEKALVEAGERIQRYAVTRRQSRSGFSTPLDAASRTRFRAILVQQRQKKVTSMTLKCGTRLLKRNWSQSVRKGSEIWSFDTRNWTLTGSDRMRRRCIASTTEKNAKSSWSLWFLF